MIAGFSHILESDRIHNTIPSVINQSFIISSYPSNTEIF